MKVKLGQAVKMFFGNSSLEMVYTEAVANALDAEASEININIWADALNKPNTLEITIKDNGIGFDVKAADSGNGLGNMQKRADALRGKIQIQSNSGEGTLVTLTVPLN